MKKLRKIIFMAIVVLLYSCSSGCIAKFGENLVKQGSIYKFVNAPTKDGAKDVNTKAASHLGNLQMQHLLRILLR